MSCARPTPKRFGLRMSRLVSAFLLLGGAGLLVGEFSLAWAVCTDDPRLTEPAAVSSSTAGKDGSATEADQAQTAHDNQVAASTYWCNVAGNDRPPTLSAEAAELRDEEPVIGVQAGRRSRAYVVSAMAHGPSTHIVNDVLDGVSISVTHCDLYQCTRLFTGGVTGQPLDLGVGGLREGGMVLKSGGHIYRQETGAPLEPNLARLPYDAYPGVTTTWGAWRCAHPDTDVYLGADLPESHAAGAKPAHAPTPLPSRFTAELGDFLFAHAVTVLPAAIAVLSLGLMICVFRRRPVARSCRANATTPLPG